MCRRICSTVARGRHHEPRKGAYSEQFMQPTIFHLSSMLTHTLENISTWIVQSIIDYVLDDYTITPGNDLSVVPEEDPSITCEDERLLTCEDNPPVAREDNSECTISLYTHSSDPSSLYSIVSSWSLSGTTDLLDPSDDDCRDSLSVSVCGTMVSNLLSSDDYLLI